MVVEAGPDEAPLEAPLLDMQRGPSLVEKNFASFPATIL
jgi:hypothetical protein